MGDQILEQCGVFFSQARFLQISAQEKYRSFLTKHSQELVPRLPVAKSANFFVVDPGRPLTFETEAIGKCDSQARPELANTARITREVRDRRIALAHKLVHILMDNGQHAAGAENLLCP